MKSSVLIFVCSSFVLFPAPTKAVPLNIGDPSERPFQGFQVLQTEATTEKQVGILVGLSESPGIDFWSFHPNLFDTNVFSVSPDVLGDVTAALQDAGMDFEVLIEDLQSSVEQETAELAAARRSGGKGAAFDRYMRYDEIYTYARELEKNSKRPVKVSVESIGKTVEKRDLWVIKVQMTDTKGLSEAEKPAIFVDAGIHAREWISPATAVYILNQLVENATLSKELLSGLNWYILPVLNPDGYEYTFTTVGNRFWRKNRNTTKSTQCMGVDLNRNYGFHWSESGSSQSPCAETYSGAKEFSEPETKAMSDYILKHKAEIKTYISLHSYGHYILYPWGYTKNLPTDQKELDDISKEANKAMVAAGSKPYKIGSVSRALYLASGASIDWAKGEAGVAKSFTIELPGGGSRGFDLPPSSIVKTVTHVFEGVRAIAKRTKSA